MEADERAYFARVKRLYGITRDEYLAILKAQGGRCYICRKAAGRARRLAVDHNHVTGEVRGLLCSGSQSANTCNRLIARYSREALGRAVEYMTEPPARAVLAELRAGKQ